jgi:hypothetical protein
MDDPHRMNKRIGAALKPISQELDTRLEGDLSGRDLAAVRTSILKACVVGMHMGTVETTAQVIEQAPGANVTLKADQLDDQLARFDLWAAEFGGT